LELSRKALEMALRADALAIRGVAIEDGGRCITGMGALVADIDLRIPIHSGRVFRFEAGHRSDLMSATIPI
ncbi:hypothetical protein, partial [Bosea vaviloviae]|uniref:hypothetical protein n=1 Tax=Bosea vaviloviae TaxID=1526658 RepID=UPI001AEC3FE2